jgi:hypothetical protein
MAVTISFGLGFATILTMLVVPTLYAVFFGAKPPGNAAPETEGLGPKPVAAPGV